MSKVLAVSEYYNEADNIPGLVENLSEQTKKPDLLVIIDDGSTDNSTDIYQKNLERVGLDSVLYTMPPKTKPDANLKGRAFTKVDILNSDWLDTSGYDYLLLIGADTLFPKTYIELCTKIMDRFPIFGTMAGRIHGEPGSDSPMGTGKIVRWSVVKKTRGRYWDLDPDSLWNLIAIDMGYQMLIPKDLLVTVTRPTHMYGARGYYNFGRRMFYVGWNLQNAIFYAMKLLAKLDQPQHFLRGYLHAFAERTWRCRDPDVEDYYSFTRMLRRNLGISHKRDFATILDIGMKPQYEEKVTPEFLQAVFSKIQATAKQKSS
ncbi:MAG: glycosyltransferase family 2 protein [Candidatus Thorarchaeota archaeon]|jgi:glycosyltransferase involved in cell wall biosynthesis